MKAIFYLYRRTLYNRIRQALRKPITFFYILFIGFYFIAIPSSLRTFAAELHMDSPSGMTILLTLLAFWMIPANVIAYTKRKGLVYRGSDTHFLFPTPISPKKVLLYAHLRTLPVVLLMNLFVTLLGKVVFGVSWWRVAVYFVFSVLMENVLEICLMLLFYGSEHINEKRRSFIIKGAYGLVLVLLAMALGTYIMKGFSLESISGLLHSGAVQMVPIIGWYVAVLHLIFMGASFYSVLGTALYGLLLAALLVGAVRMRSEGGFYEDAIKFADDYEEAISRNRRGEINKGIGRKEKFGRAKVSYQGGGAKAIFYRQLLEYKKTRFFLFDITTVMALGGGIFIAWLYRMEGGFGSFTNFIIPAAGAYLIFCFTAFQGKWSKELAVPYTYLIPDTPFHKLWYATALQHVQALVNGLLLTLPGCIVMELSPLTAVLCVALYVSLNANKLYAYAVAQALVGNVLGRTAKQLLQLLLQGIGIGIGVMFGILGMIIGGVDVAYLIMTVILLAENLIFMTIAMLNFYKMETA